MVDLLTDTTVGLRERKKLRTRATLIDAAVRLCLAQGYEQTTVEQIAALAEVSTRTFSRYFATKEAVILTLLEGLTDAVARGLPTIPAGVPALEALRRVHVDVLSAVPSGTVPGLTSNNIVAMLQIINSTPALQAAAAGFWPPTNIALLAERLGVRPQDRKVRLVTAVWSSIITTACGDLVADTDGTVLGPEVMIERIDSAFADFATLTVGLSAGPG